MSCQSLMMFINFVHKLQGSSWQCWNVMPVINSALVFTSEYWLNSVIHDSYYLFCQFSAIVFNAPLYIYVYTHAYTHTHVQDFQLYVTLAHHTLFRMKLLVPLSSYHLPPDPPRFLILENDTTVHPLAQVPNFEVLVDPCFFHFFKSHSHLVCPEIQVAVS